MTRSAKTPRYDQFNQHPLCYGRFHERSEQLGDLLVGRQLMVELGAGEAHVGLEFARANQDWLVLAVDRKADRLLKAAKRAVAEGLGNIYFVQAELQFLSDVIDLTALVDIIWVTFPDPYFKDKQKKHRLTGPRQRQIFNTFLKPGGKLRFKTDNIDLFEDTVTSIEDVGDYSLTYVTRDLHKDKSDLEADVRAVTKYEAKFVASGLKINYLEASLN